MKIFKKSILGVAALLAAGALSLSLVAKVVATPKGEAPTPVVIELFTSQGCSSCPPADSLLGQLSSRDGIIALSLPIDYWDYLGWKDTLARPENADRQRAYNRNMHRGNIYTPQMVLQGRYDAIGSHVNEVEAAIDRVRQNMGQTVPLMAVVRDDALEIELPQTDGRWDCTVYAIPYMAQSKVAIARGENRNRNVTYYNVSQGLQVAGKWTGEARTFNHAVQGDPRPSGYVVLVQDQRHGLIRGALQVELKGAGL